MIAPVVVVADEGRDSSLKVGGQLIRHLVDVPFDGLVVALQLPVGLRVESLSAAATVAIRPRIEAHIAWLERELDDLDEGLRQTLRQSPVWREKDDLLRTAPGVGEQLSLTLLAYPCRSWARWTAGRSPPWWE